MRHFFLTLVASLYVVSATVSVHAASPAELEQARTLFLKGEEHLQANRFREAEDAFGAVFKVVAVPSVALRLGTAHEKQGELVGASQAYQTAMELSQNDLWADPALQRQSQKDAEVALRAIQERIPTLRIKLLGEARVASLALDGKPLSKKASENPIPVDPGSHTVEAITKDNGRVAGSIMLAEREQKTLTLEMQKLESATQPTLAQSREERELETSDKTPKKDSLSANGNGTTRAIAYSSLGVGAAGLGLGIAAGVDGFNRHRYLRSRCDKDNYCPPDVYDKYNDSYNAARYAATAGFIIAGAGAALGVTLLILSDDSHRSQVGVSVGPSSVFAHGTFQ